MLFRCQSLPQVLPSTVSCWCWPWQLLPWSQQQSERGHYAGRLSDGGEVALCQQLFGKQRYTCSACLLQPVFKCTFQSAAWQCRHKSEHTPRLAPWPGRVQTQVTDCTMRHPLKIVTVLTTPFLFTQSCLVVVYRNSLLSQWCSFCPSCSSSSSSVSSSSCPDFVHKLHDWAWRKVSLATLPASHIRQVAAPLAWQVVCMSNSHSVPSKQPQSTV